MQFNKDVLHFHLNLPFPSLPWLTTAPWPPPCRRGGVGRRSMHPLLPVGRQPAGPGKFFLPTPLTSTGAAGVRRPRPWPSSSSHSPSTLIIAGKRSSSGQPISPRDGALSIHPKLLLISKSQADPRLAHSHLAGSPARDPAWRNTGSGRSL